MKRTARWSSALLAVLVTATFAFNALVEGKGKPPKDDPPPATDPLYEYVDLGNLGGDDVYTFAINNHNDVVGDSTTTDGVWHAYLCTTDANGDRLPMIDLNDFVPAGSSLVLTRAIEINDYRRQIAGQGELNGHLVGFRLTPPFGATMTIDVDGVAKYVVDGVETAPELLTLLPPFAVEAEARDVNLDGIVVGPYRDSNGDVGTFVYTDDDGFVDLGAFALGATSGSTPEKINDLNEIVGTAWLGSAGSRAWKYTLAQGYVEIGVLDEAVQSPFSRSTAMNSQGDVVGTSPVGNGKGKRQTSETHGFLHADGVMLDIGGIYPAGINDLGDIVARDTNKIVVLFADPDVGLIDVNSVVQLPNELAAMSDPLQMPDINDAGVITGYSGQSFEGVPEKAFLLVPISP